MENAYAPTFTREELDVAREQHNETELKEAIAQLWNDVNAVISGAKDYCATTGNEPYKFFREHPIELPLTLFSRYRECYVNSTDCMVGLLGLDRTQLSSGASTSNAEASPLFADFIRPLLEAGFNIEPFDFPNHQFALS